MVTRKDRRNSGYVTPEPTVSKKDLIKYDLFVDSFYDDWCNYRDAFRDFIGDFKNVRNFPPVFNWWLSQHTPTSWKISECWKCYAFLTNQKFALQIS